MDVHFNSESLVISNRKVVTGILSLNLPGGQFFPEEKWNDNVVVILDAWVCGLDKLQYEEFGSEDFYFMDGPFFFRIIVKKQKFIAEFFVNRKIIDIREFNINHFKYSVKSKSKELIEEVLKKGWMNPDIEKLIKHCDFK